jgi:hypothetical protein
MGTLPAPSPRVLIEPCPAPVIPVTGVGAVTLLSGGVACITLFQELPVFEAGAVHCQVAVHLMWPRVLIVPAMRELFHHLQETPVIAELGPRLVR